MNLKTNLTSKLRIQMIWHDTSTVAIEIISAPPHKKTKLICGVFPQFPNEIWLHIFQYIPDIKTMVNCIFTSKPETNDLARFAMNYVGYKATKIIQNTLKTMANHLGLEAPTFSSIDTKCMEFFAENALEHERIG